MTQRPALLPLLTRLPPPPLARPALGLALTAFLRRIAQRNPSILSRLGPYAGARFLLDVRDGPFLLLMQPEAQRLSAHSRRTPEPAHDAAIRGGLAAFLAMLHGAEDGDALFFSGELQIGGDTSAVLALRNALDDAELDLTEELAALSGQFGGWLRRGSALAARKSGLILSRQEVLP
ncbi:MULTISPECIES: ubiquinone anaerobic biosynthesis accessory factor UbiT [Paracoccus]|uniref:Sterol-binding protein n=1 Tax=Paracoccus kondratievae TaxID=135740 RepID=A0AAD3P0A5_9RHOB|nr:MULTISPECIES: SCP2 sterol-binding domain-containing protein [Paracoccus]GLK64610.1 sterol-binding protein [Paracoccus kondratievae]SMG22178.1 Predicted lipid carrier protein YhbT, contains SCP2 domain [Paracoccus sp. J56]